MAVFVGEVLRIIMTIITLTRKEMNVRTVGRKEKVLNFLLSLHLLIKCVCLSVESSRMTERPNTVTELTRKNINTFDQDFQTNS